MLRVSYQVVICRSCCVVRHCSEALESPAIAGRSRRLRESTLHLLDYRLDLREQSVMTIQPGDFLSGIASRVLFQDLG